MRNIAVKNTATKWMRLLTQHTYRKDTSKLYQPLNTILTLTHGILVKILQHQRIIAVTKQLPENIARALNDN